jgi:tight adherence protein B
MNWASFFAAVAVASAAVAAHDRWGSNPASSAAPALAIGAAALVAAAPETASVGALILAATAIGSAGAVARRSRRVTPVGLVDCLERLATALRSGASPRQALGEIASESDGPLGDDLRSLHHRLDLGLPLADTLRWWPRLRPGVSEIADVSAALATALEAGGSAARAVDDVADSVRARHELEAEVAALASQARASAILIGLLPLMFASVLAGVDPESLTMLVTTTVGRVCLLVGVSLYAVGWLWMARIVRGVEP